ncbi:family 1 extracellular solute-binding protein [Bifidobacterium ramosum]|uniref:Extracellular solute-binding protein n=1 Tax=Bifidobacterium ramosum TaxID=1798158 RepID=A0A6L4WYR5_9BIFI|nr:extracellular solute-binding protein [Bifidobacterium ramosum]KAB8287232.1 family 1 extracellular solute-binding protein [Bifidobacterium ramosum]NEG71942.1 extracellular solute-binding protein [Bifidobacterium ramosum]
MKRNNLVKMTVAAVAAVATIAPMAACGSTGSADGKTTLTMFTWDNDEAMKPYIEAFEKKYPNIKVDQSSAPNNGDKDSILNQRLSGGQAPDVFTLGYAGDDSKVTGGYTMDITNEPFVEKMSDANKAYESKDGKVYGVSVTSWESGIVYNKDLLKKVGADGIPSTWDEFLALCKKLKDAGITPFLEHIDETPHLVAACVGGKFAKEGNTDGDLSIINGKTTFTKEYTDCLDQWYQLYDQGLESRDSVGVSGDQIVQQFNAGELAMFITGAWDFTKLNEGGQHWKMGLVPTFDGGEANYGAGSPSPGYAIYSKTKHADAAKKWLEFMISKEALDLQAKAGNIVTVKGYTQDVDPGYTDVYKNGLQASKYYLPVNDWGPKKNAINTEWTAQFQLLVQGQQTPKQTAENMDAKLKSLS